jgi:ribosomal protein S18 acetylase RimI-like enzyme
VKKVELRELAENQIPPYFEELWEKYRSELIEAGFSPEYADESVEQSKKSLTPDGKLESGHFIFYAYSENHMIGQLWLASIERDGKREWSIFDIETFSDFRGQGFGRAIMLAAEDYVRAAGGDSISLSVFGNNKVARSLYESLDYQTLRVGMKKALK